MKTTLVVAAVLVCAVLSTTADTLAVQYWKKPNPWAGVVLIVLSPLVFLSFGYVGSHYSLSVAACLTNSLAVLGPILVGLILFSEYKKMSPAIYFGMILIVLGIIIISFGRRETG